MHLAAKTLCGALVLAGAACEQSPLTITANPAEMALRANVVPGTLPALAQEVRRTTARFNSVEQAMRAGYEVDTHCVASPAGGMGYHYPNLSLIDPVFDARNPETLLYARDRSGQLRLVAVEYVVVDVGQPTPTFDGQAFDVGGSPLPLPHWTLHVWIFEENSNGLFAPFNPAVSCP